MKTAQHRTLSVAAALLAAGTLPSYAVITSVSTSVPTGTDEFSNGSSDYFGLVDNGGTMIAGTTFSPNVTAPPADSVAGRDHDGQGGSDNRTASWTLNITNHSGAIAPFSNISFRGTLAARDTSAPWDRNPSGDDDFILFELYQDGVLLASESKDYRANSALNFSGNLALDTNADLRGDGADVTPAGQALAMTGTTANSTIEVRITAQSNSSTEEWWASGELSADIDIVPEPSSSLMLALAGGLLAFRRKK